MAKCEQGYLCDVCHEDVESIVDSDLYLRFVIGMVDPETLHTQPERHIRCHPVLAQFLVHPDFPVVTCEAPFGKQGLDAEFVAQREDLVTRGWLRLRELEGADLPIHEYPLEEVRTKWTG